MDRGKAAVQGNVKTLQEMISKLELVERHLHSDNAQLPTLAENRLYGLIMRHVRFYIQLFYVEKGTIVHNWLGREKLMESEDEKEKLLQLLFFIYCGNYYAEDISCPSGQEVQLEVSLVWERVFPLIDLLKKTRKYLANMHDPFGEVVVMPSWSDGKKRTVYKGVAVNSSKTMPATEAMAGEAVAGYVQDKRTTREQYLFDILQGLEDMGRSRSYCPPNEGEIQYYQEIRMRVTSYIWYIQVKPVCKRHIFGEEDWVSHAPAGYRLSTALDELPDLLSLTKECRCHFSEICSILFRKSGVEIVTDDGEMERGEEQEAQGSKLKFKKRKRMEERWYDAPIPNGMQMPVDKGQATVGNNELNKKPVDKGQSTVGNNELNKKTREQYHHEILRVVKKLESVCFDNQPLVGEIRLYAQIVEHVTTSIWMYETQPKDLQGGSVGSEKINDLVAGDSSGASYGLSDCEKKSREEFLQEVLLSVEVIKSSFLDTPPKASEIVLYKEIATHINPELLNSKISCQMQGEAEFTGINNFPPATAISKCLLRVVYDWELKLFKQVQVEYAEMVKSIFPGLLGADASMDPLKWVDQYYNDCRLRELAMLELWEPVVSLPHGFELLDRLILILLKIHAMLEHFHSNLMDGNKNMDSLLDMKMDLEVAQEVSSALQVLKLHLSTPFPNKSCWGSC